MDVERKNYIEKRFFSVERGDVFLYEDILYMKIESVEGMSGTLLNAVRVLDGRKALLAPGAVVRLVKCKMIIEED